MSEVVEALVNIIEKELTRTEIRHLKSIYEKVLINPMYSGVPTLDDLKEAIELL